MTLEQILAIIIFAVMFIAIMWGRVHRYIPALIGAALHCSADPCSGRTREAMARAAAL